LPTTEAHSIEQSIVVSDAELPVVCCEWFWAPVVMSDTELPQLCYCGSGKNVPADLSNNLLK
jgi:hypothetical protein